MVYIFEVDAVGEDGGTMRKRVVGIVHELTTRERASHGEGDRVPVRVCHRSLDRRMHAEMISQAWRLKGRRGNGRGSEPLDWD